MIEYLKRLRLGEHTVDQFEVFRGYTKRTIDYKSKGAAFPDEIISKLGGTYLGNKYDFAILKMSNILDFLSQCIKVPSLK